VLRERKPNSVARLRDGDSRDHGPEGESERLKRKCGIEPLATAGAHALDGIRITVTFN